MSFLTAIGTCLRKYDDYSGRAGRAEFWYWMIFVVSSILLLDITDHTFSGVFSEWPILSISFSMLTTIPSIAVMHRRLQDVGHPGWHMLTLMIPIIGWFIVLYWLTAESGEDNKYGPRPSV